MAKEGELKMPYLYGEARDALETVMQWEIYSEGPEMESQWKQPYKYESYPKMEAEFSGPQSPLYPQPPGGQIGSDCTPKGDAVGGGALDPCNPGINCGKWIFSCAHRIKSFGVPQTFGWIQSIQYYKNDTVAVVVCWNEGNRFAGMKIGPKAVMFNGQSIVSTIDMQNCCPDKAVCGTTCGKCSALSIGHSTHQMSVNDTQVLSASGGGGKYTWSLSGGGKLSETKYVTTVYTAPASNANCALNPTITLKDCCGASTNIKIAVNAVGGGVAYKIVYDAYGDGCIHQIWQTVYSCGGIAGGTTGCDSCDCQVAGCCCSQDTPCTGFVCSHTNIVARCGSPAPTCTTCVSGTYDMRTEEQKALGCCPAALL